MRKYLAVFKISFQRSLEYRARAIVWILVDTLAPLFLAIIFAGAVRSGETVGGFGRSSFVIYFLILILFKNFVQTHKEEDFSEQIKSGKLSNFLIKPIDYFFYQFFNHLGWAFNKVLLSLPVFLVLLIAFNRFLGLSYRFNYNLAALAFLLLLSLFCDFCYSMLLGLSSFWVLENFAFYSFMGIFVFIFSGGLVPLELFPDSLRNIVLLTPFPHLLYSPVKMALGLLPAEAFLFSAGILVYWIWLIYTIYRRLWKSGLKVYEGMGL